MVSPCLCLCKATQSINITNAKGLYFPNAWIAGVGLPEFVIFKTPTRQNFHQDFQLNRGRTRQDSWWLIPGFARLLSEGSINPTDGSLDYHYDGNAAEWYSWGHTTGDNTSHQLLLKSEDLQDLCNVASNAAMVLCKWTVSTKTSTLKLSAERVTLTHLQIKIGNALFDEAWMLLQCMVQLYPARKLTTIPPDRSWGSTWMEVFWYAW
jgi:hypothetical protein